MSEPKSSKKQTSTVTVSTEPAAKDSRPWFKKKRFVIPIGLLLLGSLSNAINDDNDSPTASGDQSQSQTDTSQNVSATVKIPDVVGKTVADAKSAANAAGIGFDQGEAGDDWVISSQEPQPQELEDTGDITLTVVAVAPEPPLTLGQENAIESAQSYLDYTGFSRKGLLDQLTSEYGGGFPKADAKFALAYLEKNGLVDWNAEAVESAQSYLDFSSFSKNALYEQLTSEYGGQFTPEQAKYALKQVGY